MEPPSTNPGFGWLVCGGCLVTESAILSLSIYVWLFPDGYELLARHAIILDYLLPTFFCIGAIAGITLQIAHEKLGFPAQKTWWEVFFALIFGNLLVCCTIPAVMFA